MIGAVPVDAAGTDDKALAALLAQARPIAAELDRRSAAVADDLTAQAVPGLTDDALADLLLTEIDHVFGGRGPDVMPPFAPGNAAELTAPLPTARTPSGATPSRRTISCSTRRRSGRVPGGCRPRSRPRPASRLRRQAPGLPTCGSHSCRSRPAPAGPGWRRSREPRFRAARFPWSSIRRRSEPRPPAGWPA